MSIDLVFVTYNRIAHTKMALHSILDDPSEGFSLTIWDNASTDGTAEYLQREVSDPRIKDIVFSRENVGQTAAVNSIWSRSKAELVGKLDNDCIVSAGWTEVLSQAHRDIEGLGVVACWHFRPEDFDYERARHKIQTFGGHQVLRHPWTCGTGLLVKRETFERFGPIRETATTQYWLRMALAGYVNGWYYPLVCQDHLDDPLSPRSKLLDDDKIKAAYEGTYTLTAKKLRSRKELLKWREHDLRNILDEPWEAKYYVGWRNKVRSAKYRVKRGLGV